MKFELKICFETTKSMSCQEVTKIASRIETFTPGKPNVVIFNDKSITKYANKLFDMITFFGRMKSNLYYLNDQEITRNELNGIFDVLRCYEDYKKTVIASRHCKIARTLPGWGCKLLTQVKRHSVQDAYSPYDNAYYHDTMWWYEAGRFTSKNVWAIDKKALQEYLKKEADNKYLALCPVFNFQKALVEIESLPDKIDLTKTNDWEKAYYQEYGETRKLTGIQPKEKGCRDAENEEDSTGSSGGGLVLRVPDDIPLDDVLPDNPDQEGEEDEPL
jgi:hypothetical protein